MTTLCTTSSTCGVRTRLFPFSGTTSEHTYTKSGVGTEITVATSWNGTPTLTRSVGQRLLNVLVNTMESNVTFKEVVDSIREQMREFGSPKAELSINYEDFDLKIIVKEKEYSEEQENEEDW